MARVGGGSTGLSGPRLPEKDVARSTTDPRSPFYLIPRPPDGWFKYHEFRTSSGPVTFQPLAGSICPVRNSRTGNAHNSQVMSISLAPDFARG